MKNKLPSEMVGVVGTIDPDAYAASTVVSDWVDMRYFHKLLAIIMAGDLGASATLDAKLRQATDSAGTGAKDITGKLITQLTQAGTDSDKQAEINLLPEEMDIAGGFYFAALSMTIGVAASDAGAILLGFEPRYFPATEYDLASVDEVIS